MNTELNKITSLVDTFNKQEYGFEIVIQVIKKEPKKYLSLQQVMQLVCKEMKITPEYLNLNSREKKIILPRQMAHYIASRKTKHTLGEIGFYFGNKDHSTVLNSVKVISNYLETDREFNDLYSDFLNS